MLTKEIILFIWFGFVALTLAAGFWAIWLYSFVMGVQERFDVFRNEIDFEVGRLEEEISNMREAVNNMKKLTGVLSQQLQSIPADDELEAMIAERRKQRLYGKQEEEFYTFEEI